MSLEQFAASLQATDFSDALKAASWVVPTLQSVHIVLIGVVFVSMLMIALRVLGRVRADQPLHAVWSRFAPFLWYGLLLMALTGALLVVAEPVREFMTLSFRLKMLLLVVAVVSAAAFGRGVRLAARAPAGDPAPIAAGTRLLAVATIVLWLAIIFLGRAIAYDDSVWGAWSPVQSLGGAAP